MQAAVARHWSLDSAWHVGDLAWDRFQHVGREHEWPTQLWLDGDEIVAWGWLTLRAVCLAVMHAAAELGAERAVVYGVELAGKPTGPPLYRALGFRPYGQARCLAKPRDGG